MKTFNFTNFQLRFLFAFILTMSIGYLSAQIIVDNNIGVNAEYSDLQAAIDAASDNATIYIHPSATTYGDITIEKPLTLVGRSHSEDSFVSTVDNVTITHNGSGTSIKGLSMYDCYLSGLNGTSTYSPILVTDITIEHSKVHTINVGQLTYYSITLGLHDGPGANNLLIRGNVVGSQYLWSTNTIVTNNYITGATYVERPDTTIITNNVFTDTTTVQNGGSSIGNVLIQNCIFIANSGTPEELNINHSQLSNCLTYNYGAGSYNLSGGTTDMNTTDMLLNTNPLFTSIDTSVNVNFYTYNPTNDYTLQTGSPAIGAGFNGEDLGLFGNGYTFNNIGNPAGYPTVTILTSTAAIPASGVMQVVFKGTAH